MRELVFNVLGKPKGKGRPRFTKSGRAYTPPDTARVEAVVRDAAERAIAAADWQPFQKGIPVRAEITAFFEIPQSWSKTKQKQAQSGVIFPTVKPDGDNIAKLVLDAVNGIAYHDDAQVVDKQIFKRYAADGLPRITVKISALAV